MSDIRMVNVRSDCDASNPASLTITRSTCRSAWQRLGEFARPRGRLHPGRGADQEFVLEHRSQSVKRVTHCWLAKADAIGRLRHVPFRQKRIKRDKQVEVDRAKVHLSFIS